MREMLFALGLALVSVATAGAADVAATRGPIVTEPQVRPLPFPRGERAAAVWDERACWSECGARTAWGMTACLARDPQGVCLRFADRSDRACQRACRTMGGPYVPDIFDF